MDPSHIPSLISAFTNHIVTNPTINGRYIFGNPPRFVPDAPTATKVVTPRPTTGSTHSSNAQNMVSFGGRSYFAGRAMPSAIMPPTSSNTDADDIVPDSQGSDAPSSSVGSSSKGSSQSSYNPSQDSDISSTSGSSQSSAASSLAAFADSARRARLGGTASAAPRTFAPKPPPKGQLTLMMKPRPTPVSTNPSGGRHAPVDLTADSQSQPSACDAGGRGPDPEGPPFSCAQPHEDDVEHNVDDDVEHNVDGEDPDGSPERPPAPDPLPRGLTGGAPITSPIREARPTRDSTERSDQFSPGNPGTGRGHTGGRRGGRGKGWHGK
jgi:hypothetical protein